MKILQFYFKKGLQFLYTRIVIQSFILLLVEWLAFHKIFSFWFFHGWEASWLIGNTNGIFTLKTLMQSHGFISALNLILFGWNPHGWFATAFLFHFLVTMALLLTIRKLSHNSVVAFIASLLFVATTADHDVITWGSFESLYAVQTFGFFITILFFVKYHETKKKLFYFLSLLSFLFSALLRESGLIFIPLLFLFEFIFYQSRLITEILKRKIHKKTFISFLWIMMPFFILGILYLLLRASYGGSPYDYIDQRVQFRILLMQEHRYLEYVWYGILAFGQYIPPYTLPYPLLNAIKNTIFTLLPIDGINIYFFVIWGWATYGALVYMLWLQRKDKYVKYLVFFLLMFSIITAFYSFAWTTYDSFLATPYSWSENRWRYFAFSALAPFFAISFYNFYNFLGKKLRKKHILRTVFISLLVTSVGINIYILNMIEGDMYLQNHAPSILFYKTLTKTFPSLDSQTRFFYYRNSGSSMNDFLAEFFYIKQHFYPKMTTLPSDWVRSQMYYVVKYLSLGTLDTTHFYFLDYSLTKGVLDKTSEALSLFRAQKATNITPLLQNDGNGTYEAALADNSPVEFPYIIDIRTSLSMDRNIKNNPIAPFTEKQFTSLLSFMPEEQDFINNTKVTVCKTMDNQINEEFHNYTYAHIADGNIQERSTWWADCRPAWVIFDLGHEEKISGFGWGSYNVLDNVPRDYEYQISPDGQSWHTILTISGNSRPERLDELKNIVSARFVRFMVTETIKRGMLSLNEFSVIPENVNDIFSAYSSYQAIFSDMYTFWYKISQEQLNTAKSADRLVAWIPFSWKTSPQNIVSTTDQRYYIPMWVDGIMHEYSFELPESELYSGPGQFLKRRITNLTFSMPFTSENVSVNSLFWEPLFPSK